MILTQKIKHIFPEYLEINFKLIVFTLIFSLISLLIPHQSLANSIELENESGDTIQGILIKDALESILDPNIGNLQLADLRLPRIEERKIEPITDRYVTAYNVGVVAQTDNTPCIGASGDNLCELVERGQNVCAANFVQLGTYLEIEGIGKCLVLDRMNPRYSSRVDIAMGPDEINQAKEFGLRRLKVSAY